MFRHLVIAVTAKYERVVYMGVDCIAVCEMAESHNKNISGVVYIVELPNGERLTIAKQRLYLANRRTVVDVST